MKFLSLLATFRKIHFPATFGSFLEFLCYLFCFVCHYFSFSGRFVCAMQKQSLCFASDPLVGPRGSQCETKL